MILGTGFTGTRIYHQAIKTGWQVLVTSRSPHLHLRDLPPAHRLHFDLAQPDTWSAIPSPAHILWCFPAAPLDLVKEFFANRPRKSGRILVMGSTSAYPPQERLITEQTPLRLHLPRVQGEEYLRTTLGAVIIRFAGLYGPNRNVLDWIRRGKIQNTPKWVNLLHVEDAANICLQALERAEDGATYLATDGCPRTWEEICTFASLKWGISVPPLTPLKNIGKKVSIHKLLTELRYTVRFPDLYQVLDQLESHSSSEEKA